MSHTTHIANKADESEPPLSAATIADRIFLVIAENCGAKISRSLGEPHPRRGGRAADCTGLENRRRGNPSQGSNPCLSASETAGKSPDFSAVFAFLSRPEDRDFGLSPTATSRTELTGNATILGKPDGKPSEGFGWASSVPVARSDRTSRVEARADGRVQCPNPSFGGGPRLPVYRRPGSRQRQDSRGRSPSVLRAVPRTLVATPPW
jgi:hypothetical protein